MREKPDWFGKTEYSQRKKAGRDIPWGYKLAKEGKMLDPIPEQLDLLRWGLILLHTGATYDDVVEWLTKISGRSLTKEGLRQIIKNEKLRRNRAKYYRHRYSSAEEIEDWRTKEIFEIDTNYPTKDEQAHKDFGVCALPSFGRARKHNSLINVSATIERQKRDKENASYRTWLKRTEAIYRAGKKSAEFRKNGVKLALLANDN